MFLVANFIGSLGNSALKNISLMLLKFYCPLYLFITHSTKNEMLHNEKNRIYITQGILELNFIMLISIFVYKTTLYLFYANKCIYYT